MTRHDPKASVGQSRKVIVVGAGIVGACCALEAQKRGWATTLVDPSEPGSMTTSGNAAMIAVGHCLPLAFPGVLSTVPSMLTDRTGPLVVSARNLVALAPWFVRFLRSGNETQFLRSTGALARLLNQALPAWMTLLGQSGRHFVETAGWLHIWRHERNFARAERLMDIRRSAGVRLERVSGEEISAQLPALAGSFAGGWVYGAAAHVNTPTAACRFLVSQFVQCGGRFLPGVARDFRIENGRVTGVRLGDQTIECDEVIICAGIWSTSLLAKLGLKVSMVAERGYSVEVPGERLGLRQPLCLAEHSVVMTPLGDVVRLAGTAEFSPVRSPPNYRRAEILFEHAVTAFPTLKRGTASPWMGARPSTPDSLPIIGRHPRLENVVVATGHGHLGLTLAPVTGQIVGDLLNGQSGRDLEPFAPGRFERFVV